MTDEATLRKEQDRGERAKRVLENDLYIEAFDQLRTDLLEELEMTNWNDRERREFIYQELRVVAPIRGYIKRVMITGENARKELLRIKDPSRLKRVING